MEAMGNNEVLLLEAKVHRDTGLNFSQLAK